eukprot:jgi/Ulvmu1/7750/UM039_0058.1
MRWAAVLVAACVVLVGLVRNRRRQKDLPKLPLAPGTLPVIGHIRAVKAMQRNSFNKLYPEHAAAAGASGVLRLRIAGKDAIVLTTPAAFAAVLRRTGFLPKPLSVYGGIMMFGMKRHPMFSIHDSMEHGRLRKHMTRCFHADTVTEAVGRLTASVDGAIASVMLCASVGGAASGQVPADGPADEDIGLMRGDISAAGVLVDSVHFAAYTILAALKVFIGVDARPPLAALHDTLDHSSATSAHPLMFPLLRLGLYPGLRRYRRNWDALYNFQCGVVREIFGKAPPEGSTTLWAALRQAFPEAMTDEEQFEDAVANVGFMYVAGYETTSNAIMHTLAALALHPESHASLVQELDEAGLLATPERPNPPPVTVGHLSSLKVLDTVCHESLRLFPPVPIAARALTQETEICGYRVPKGTAVILEVGGMHYNKHAWGEDAMSWRPQRWLEGRSKAAVKKAADGSPRFLPFLDGSTNCIGQHLGMVELKMVMAMVVSVLHVALDAQRMGHLLSVEDYLGECVSKVTLQRNSPCWLRLRPRALGAH